MRAKTCLYGHIQRPARTNEDIPHEGCLQNRSAVYQTPVSFGQPQPGIGLSLFAGNHPTVDVFEDQKKNLPYYGVLHESHK